ncbi:uncharacterized protein [Montipora foliosa]|uniref:uncharacterized protein n=1 Tax=Montipora foliosa TaxID=591990 RepID=UPI0035F1C7B7
MNRSVLVVLLCVGWASLGLGSSWNYDDPKSWKGVCKKGEKQSPIDITGATQNDSLGDFTLTNYDMKIKDNFTAKNTGGALKVSFPEKFYNVSKGGLTGTYTTVQLHLHWGDDNSKGSEHTVDGKKYAAELHFVSYNTKYSDLGASLSHADGAAVLGVLIEVGGEDNDAFSFFEIASDLTKAKTNTTIKPFKFEPILPKDKTKYFRYQGSLTTPTCNEAVTWTVFKDHVNISQGQMDLLRSLKYDSGKPMVNNYRPVQKLYQRKITASFVVPTNAPASTAVTTGSGSSWNYDDPESWKGVCKTGEEQSPIDITGATQNEALGDFTLTNYDMKIKDNFTAKNTGGALKVSFPEKFYNVSKGGLTGTYTTVQLHLHWGDDNSKGSEHTVDGKKYAAELHFVSYNTKYSDLVASLSHADGAAVLGVLIEVGGEDNDAFSFFEIASYLTKAKTNTTIKPFKFEPILPKDKTKYFRYQGSLTTPTCNEAVTWTVFKDPVKISQRQMDLLRSLKYDSGKPMVNNYRPVQKLYQRKITASFVVRTNAPASTAVTTDTSASAVLVLSMLPAFLFLR